MAPELRMMGVLLSFGLVGVVLLHRYVFVPASLSLLRQDLFAVRRTLFLIGARGEIPFNHPAYTHTRSTINGLLRFAERTTLLRILLVTWTSRKFVPAHYDQLATLESEALRGELREIRMRVGLALAAHLVRTSPLMWLVFLAGLLFHSANVARSVLHGQYKEIAKRVGARFEPVAEALAGECAHGQG